MLFILPLSPTLWERTGSSAAEPPVPGLEVSGFGDCGPLLLCLGEPVIFEASPISRFS